MSDIDMDMDDLLLDGSTQVHSRPSRFAPKGAKMKPRPKLEPSQPASDSKKEEPEPECSNVADAMDTDVEQKPENGLKKEEEGDVDASMEADDDVVREIDVYFNAQVDPETQLYVIQFPLRPLWRPYELDERCEEVRVKPKTSEVEIDLTVDVDSKNYDSGADPRLLTKKLTLATNWIPSLSTDYAVGVLNENKLYLNPVHAVVQLRKSMRYLDPNEVSKGKSIVPSNVEPMEVKPLRASKMQTKIVEQNKESGEGWVSLKYHGLRSNMATESLRKMMAQVDSPIRFSMSQHDYLDSLCPGTSRNNDNPKVPSRRDLSLPLNERFKSWLVKGAAFHRFDTLKYLAPDEPVEAVLEVLQELARLVQGLWVPKSSLVYGTNNGLEFCARESVLILFSKSPIVSRSQLPRRPQLAKAMEQVLNVLAVHRPSFSDWKLRELPDTNFIRQYPSIAKKQEEDWDHTEKVLNDQFGGKSVKTSSSKSNAVTNTMIPKSSNNSVSKPQTVLPLRTAMPQEVREAVVNALEKLFKAVKVCSFRQISQRLREIAVSGSTRSKGFSSEAVTAANNIDTYPDDLQAVISQVAYNIHGICVPISSPDYPEYDAYRKVVIDLFIAEGANAKLRKGQILEAAKLVVKKELPFPEYLKVLREMCTAQGSVWVLKTGEQKAVN